MLKFFRKIRQQLVDTGQTKRYVLYAIGEILLVVIGILIVLQINTWNQERKDRLQEHYYLEALKEEFIAIQIKTDNILKFHETQINNANLVLNVLTEDTIVHDLENLHTALLNLIDQKGTMDSQKSVI